VEYPSLKLAVGDVAARCLLTVMLSVTCLATASRLPAQETTPGTDPALTTSVQPPKPEPKLHRFWDGKNAALFAGVAGARALDYASTRHFRGKGVDEILLTNRIVDNKPLFVAIEAAGVAASIGVSYLFHRSGHHKLERWVSVIHISVGTAGAIRNFGLEPKQLAGTLP
jgi:hypothetical protein